MEFSVKGVKFSKFDINLKASMEEYLSKLGETLQVDISDYTFASNSIWLQNTSGFYAIVEDSFLPFCDEWDRTNYATTATWQNFRP